MRRLERAVTTLLKKYRNPPQARACWLNCHLDGHRSRNHGLETELESSKSRHFLWYDRLMVELGLLSRA
jgi:hypothetical protein